MKLATKLIILFLLLTTIPLAVVGYLAYDNGRQTIEQNVLNHLISTNILKQNEFDRWVKGNERSLRELARRPLVREYATTLASQDPNDPEYQAAYASLIEDHLSPTLEEEGGFLDLSILRGDDGLILISSTHEGLEGKYRESEPFFVEGRSRTYAENVTYSLALGELVMHISTPIQDREGNLIAVLASHADLAEMSDIMEQRSGLSQTEDTYLVNTFNFFVTEPKFGEGYALKKAVRTEGVEACLQHNDGVGFYEDYRGVPVIGAYRWMPERELCILTEVDQAEAYAPIVTLRNTVLGIGLGVALIVALLGVLFARSITGPVRQLVVGVEEIGRGNLEYQIEVRGRDEIGQLSQAFNQMTENLQVITASRDELNREIAERKRAEEVLRESEERYRLLLGSITDGVQVQDREFRYLLVNDELARMAGMPKEKLLGSKMTDLFPGVEETVFFKTYKEVLETGESAVASDEFVFEDGRRAWIEVHAYPAPEGLLVIVTDITERVRAEESIRLLSTAVETSVDAISVASPVDGKLLFCNDAFLKQWKVEGDYHRLSYPHCFDVAPSVLKEAVKATMEGGWTGELTAKAMDGQTFPVLTTASPVVDEEGRMVGMLGVFKDITERKQAEEKLKEYSERLEEMVEQRTKELREAQDQLVHAEKLAVLGQLAGGVGHELRNPLGAIKNAAYFLNMVIEDADPEVKETLEILEKEVGTCAKIISSLLDFARPKPPVRRKVDANDVVQEALSRTTVPENVEVACQLDEALPTILADPDQLAQVFGNLILNGAQAMPDGGQLVVKSEVLSPEWVAVSVADTGVGISEEDLEKIFEPLFTTKAKGIGLGLALVKTLVEGHGGSIEVESEVGKGSTFTIRLRQAGADSYQ